jgi:hypothetical protein
MALFLLASASCSYRRAAPPEKSPVPQQTNQPEQSTPKPGRQQDKLSKSDQDAVEENINGFDISKDKEITRTAESLQMTQIRTGVDQNELKQISAVNTAGTDNTVLLKYDTKLPAEIKYDVKYTKYDLTYDYFLVTSGNEVIIRKSPDPNDAEACKTYSGEKLALHEKISGKTVDDSDIWYKVSCKDKGNITTGYIHSSAGITRTFQFSKMLDALKGLKQQVSKGKLNHVSNYKNVNGAPPSKGDAATDEFGMRIYQSAPGYFQANTSSDFRYVPDGMLVRILGESGDLYRVFVDIFGKELYIPKKYIDPNDALSQLIQAIVVDRNQQNQAAFDLAGNEIRMVSYTLATTGLKSDTSFETPLGDFKAIEKKDRFQYLKDGSDQIAGYAPFATRFCGGAYIHGVPVAYEEKNGQQIDPGITEYLQTIGTFPRSHMCVRNFSSHAEFIYNWMDTAKGAVIVIE